MMRVAPAIALRGARARDYAEILALLAEAGLPADDLRPECVDWFVVAWTDAQGASGADEADQGSGVTDAKGAKGTKSAKDVRNARNVKDVKDVKAVTTPPAARVVGAGAVQPLGGDGLLRSVIVTGALRGQGLGARIVEALEANAIAQGLAALYLLTADAPGFFESLGYRRIARADAPAAVRASAQFASICPASAVCMARALDARALGATGGPARTVR
jgi:N-acetylglutamate synthase-like GNAT family acetyltransferase